MDPTCLDAVRASEDGAQKVVMSFMHRNAIYARYVDCIATIVVSFHQFNSIHFISIQTEKTLDLKQTMQQPSLHTLRELKRCHKCHKCHYHFL